MQPKAIVWLATFSLLAFMLAGFPARSFAPKNMPQQVLLQEPTATPKPTSAPTRQNTRPPRPTPTPPPPLSTQHNPGLIIGAIIVVAIILFGVFRFTRK